MFFAVTQPGKPAYEVVMTRSKQGEFIPQSVGTLLCGPIRIPPELAFFFDEEFHNLLPGPIYQWALKLKFIAEAMILLGWQQTDLHIEENQERVAPPGLRSEIGEWIDELHSVQGNGERAAKRALAALEPLRELGCRAYREDSRMHEALCH